MIALPTLSTMIVGLNPALQRRFILSSSTPTLIPGQVHRAESVQEGIGGKGQDVAVALSCLYPSHLESVLLAQFLGLGTEGDTLHMLLQNKFARHSWIDWTVRTNSKLRTCTTIVSQADATELVEPSGIILAEELKELIDKWTNSESYGNNVIGGLCFMGSLPPGCQTTIYSTLYHELFTQSIPRREPLCCVVDTVVGLNHLIDSMALIRENRKLNYIQSLNMIKINRMELLHLTQKQGIHNHNEFLTVKQLQDIMEAIHRIYSTSTRAIDCIAITNGKSCSYLVSCIAGFERIHIFYEYKIPNLSQIFSQQQKLYPIGAGDAVAAGTVAAWQYLKHKNIEIQPLKENIRETLDGLRNKKYLDDEAIAFAFGLACGSASCLQEQNSVFDTDDAIKIINNIQVHRLN